MNLVLDPWERILQEPEFQGLEFEKKRRVASNFFDQEIAAEEGFSALSPVAQQRVRQNFMATLGPQPEDPTEELGQIQSFFNATYNSGVQTIADYYALAGEFEAAEEFSSANVLPTVGGVSEFAGGVVGGIAPSAVALLGGPLTAWLVAAHYGLQSAGSARREVARYRETNPEASVEPLEELAVTVGSGAIGLALSAINFGKFLRPALRNTSPALVRKIGMDLLGGKVPPAVRSIIQMAAGEGLEEGGQEAANNALMRIFINPEQALLENVGMSALGGALGGSLLNFGKLLPKYRRGLREDRAVFENARQEVENLGKGMITSAAVDRIEARFRATGDRTALEDLQRHMAQVQFYSTIFGADPEQQPEQAVDHQVLLLPEFSASTEQQLQQQLAPPSVPLLAEGAKQATPLLAPPRFDAEGEVSEEFVDELDPNMAVEVEASGKPIPLPTSRVILHPGGPAAQWEVSESIEVAFEAANAAALRLEEQLSRGYEPRKTLAAYDAAMAELHTQWTLTNPGDLTGDGLYFYINQRIKGRNVRPRRYQSSQVQQQRAQTRQEVRELRNRVRAEERAVIRPNQRAKRRAGTIGKNTLNAMTAAELQRYQTYLAALKRRRERRAAQPQPESEAPQPATQPATPEQAVPAAEPAVAEPRPTPPQPGPSTEQRPRARRLANGVTGEDVAAASREGISPNEAMRRRESRNRDIVEANRKEQDQGGKPFRIEQAPDADIAELQKLADAIGVDVTELRMSDIDTRRTLEPDESQLPPNFDKHEEDSYEFQARYDLVSDAGYEINGMSQLSAQELHRREPTVLQRHRLTNLLVRNGFFSKVHWTGGQIVGPDGQRKNAVVNTATGEVWFSRDIEFGTIGHEATHRLIELLGKNHPLVQQGLEIVHAMKGADPQKAWGADEEVLSDLVGKYFEGKQAEVSRSTWERFVNWLHDLWVEAKVRIGLPLLNQDIIHALNARLARHITNDLALEPMAAAKHMNDVYYTGKSDRVQSRKSGTFQYQDKAEPVRRPKVNISRDDVLRELYTAIDGMSAEDLRNASETADELKAKALKVLLDPRSLANVQKSFGRGGGRVSVHGLLALRIKANLRFKTIFTQIANEQAQEQPNDVQLEALHTELNKELQLLADLKRFAGRALQSMNIHAGPQAVIDAVSKLERSLTQEELAQLNEMIDTGAINDPLVVKNFADQLGPSSVTDQFWSLVMQGWLSGIPTHLINIGNNTTWMAWQIPHRALSATIDRGLTSVGKSGNLAAKAVQYVFPAIRGREREVFLGEVVPFITGLKKGRERAKSEHVILETLKGNVSLDMITKIGVDMSSARRAWARSPRKWQRDLAPYVDFPGNALFAMDVYFRTLGFDAQLNALAYREARKTGKPMRDILAHPGKAMVKQSQDFASMVTFNDKPGPTARFVMYWRDRMPFQAGRMVVPFVNTLTNIFKRGIEMTPGIGTVAHRKRLRAAESDIIAKQVEGLMIGAVLMLMFDPDDITTEVPSSPTERATFYQQGKIPYAIKMPEWLPGVGGTWVSYGRVEPFNTVISSIATAWKVISDPKLEPGDKRIVATMTQLADGLWGNLISTTYADNAQRLFRPNIGEGIKRTIERIPASLVPYSGFWRSIYRAYEAGFESFGGPEEAVVRQRVGWTSEMAQVVPFGAKVFSEEQRGLPRIDAFGETITIPGNAFRQWLPLKWSTPDMDSVEQELARLDAMPGLPSRHFQIRGEQVEMPEEQYYEYSMAYGKRTKDALARLLASPGYQRLTDEQKLQRIDRLTRRVHSTMRARGRRALQAARR